MQALAKPADQLHEYRLQSFGSWCVFVGGVTRRVVVRRRLPGSPRVHPRRRIAFRCRLVDSPPAFAPPCFGGGAGVEVDADIGRLLLVRRRPAERRAPARRELLGVGVGEVDLVLLPVQSGSHGVRAGVVVQVIHLGSGAVESPLGAPVSPPLCVLRFEVKHPAGLPTGR
jgi:hypothetical protein